MEKPLAATRRVDDLGRIVVPIEIRKRAGIERGEEFEISVQESSGEIVLRRVKKACLKCGATERLHLVKPGCYLCESCIDALKEEMVP